MSRADSATYVGHATVLVDLDGTRLLTDPVLRPRVGPLVRHGPLPPPQTTADIDAVLISHLHHDHADLASLRRLGREVPLLVPPGAAGFFARHGFGDVTELAPGDSGEIGALTVTAVEADHDGGRRRGAAEVEPVGFLIAGSRSVYFAGDTDLFAGMEGLVPGLDLALLPVWGWGPTLGPGHLDPEGAARAAAMLAPRLAIPIHWGTLYPLGLARLRPGRLNRPAAEFAARARELAPQVETRVLSPGESTSLS
ncbi:MAG TPA: MBL fold metallo-hydrolase [Solirubrobacterales bacterium]|nr:MBL fold metallo-hydrolase [Solirubrobacterales bacterium]